MAKKRILTKTRAPKQRKSSPKKHKISQEPKVESDLTGRFFEQMKEPLSLLNTLKEEGLSNAFTLFTLAQAVTSGAKKNFRMEALRPQIKDLVSSLGFALREDVERLESKLEDLEHLLSEKDFEKLGREEE